MLPDEAEESVTSTPSGHAIPISTPAYVFSGTTSITASNAVCASSSVIFSSGTRTVDSFAKAVTVPSDMKQQQMSKTGKFFQREHPFII